MRLTPPNQVATQSLSCSSRKIFVTKLLLIDPSSRGSLTYSVKKFFFRSQYRNPAPSVPIHTLCRASSQKERIKLLTMLLSPGGSYTTVLKLLSRGSITLIPPRSVPIHLRPSASS